MCNLASLSLPAFVREGSLDVPALIKTAKIVARNLDRVIDLTYYPLEAARRSNLRHRPVGIGVQGLQDALFELRLPFDSPEAATFNRQVFEALYFGALQASCELARDLGAYETFAGSPASEGRLQFDLWGVQPGELPLSWDTLKRDVAAHGLRNSLSVACMPTASTAQLLGNCESIEPQTSNLYSRRTLAGEFVVINTRLVRDMLARGLWNTDVKDAIVAANGSVQGVPQVPDDLKRLYKTAWELSMKTLIDMAADRGPYVCQSQSMNLFVASPNFRKLTSMAFHGWRRGLKTGSYYMRTRAAAKAVQVTVDHGTLAAAAAAPGAAAPGEDECVACSG